MQDVRNDARYDSVAKSLHWLTVFLVATQFAIAWTMPAIRRGVTPVGLIGWHLSVGTIILAVMFIRAGWRITHREPPAPVSLPPVMQFVSRTTHVMLYVLLFALPLLGWANASARGWPVRLFGIVPLPPLSALGSPVGQAMGDLHQNVALVLLGVIALHVLGALYHGVVLRDRTVQRMI